MSTVLIIPIAHRDVMNAIANSLGYGSANLSVPLLDATETVTHYGCHSWRRPIELDIPPPLTPEQQDALAALHVREVQQDEIPLEVWETSLAGLGLHQEELAL